jgi:hypothetical protein
MNTIFKYPRTPHLEGSRLQPGDEDLRAVPFSEIQGEHLVVEEKMDGANAAISFGEKGELRLQSRGHFLAGGGREKHFALFKQWATTHAAALWDRLGRRYVMYGEWLFAKHTVFYDALPHYFLEFDVLDTQTGVFLDTRARQQLLDAAPVVSVRVLREGRFRRIQELLDLIGPSHFIRPGHLERLGDYCREHELNVERVFRETDRSGQMEGLYIKAERDGAVTGRYKFVRAGFLTAVFKAEGHWLNRPVIPNQLQEGVDLFQGG